MPSKNDAVAIAEGGKGAALAAEEQTASGKTAENKNREKESAAAEESVDHAADVERAREDLLWYAKKLKDVNEAAKFAQDKYFETVNALYWAENSKMQAFELRNKRRREGNHDMEHIYQRTAQELDHDS